MEYLEKYNETIKEQWYKNLIDDCKTIITEAVFTSRWALVEGYHQLGERVRTDCNFIEYSKGNKTSVQGLAQNLGISERTLYYAIQFYDKYPELEKVPEGKNITWNKIITKYLPKPKENKIELPLPEGKYNVIIIDPPWPYGTEYDSEVRRVASPYPEMSLEQIKDIKLPTSDNCILWLWTTHKFIKDAFIILENWDFEYKLILTWDKQKLGIGSWLRCQMEFCLLGIKGKPEWNLTNERDFISEARREHSRKPDSFYNMIRKLNSGRILDYFSREERDGIVPYGNETNKFQSEK